jgi:7-carboxy-7-deazaguanine synthase
VARLSKALAIQGHHITVETAGTVWCEDLHCDLMSISPKLRHAAPDRGGLSLATRHEETRWAPDVVARLCAAFPTQLKFVVRPTPEGLAQDLDEIDEWLSAARLTNLPAEKIFLMPEGVDPDALPAAYQVLTSAVQTRGYRIGPRLHLTLFGHTPGT